MDSLFKKVGKQNEKLLSKEKLQVETSELNKNEILSKYDFSFEIDEETMDYLKEQTFKLHFSANKMYTELGKIFRETQEKLADHKDGVFVKWFETLGFKRDTVYRYIGRYNLLANSNDIQKEKIETLSLKIAYEISKDSYSEEIKEQVIEGKIKTLEELKKFSNKVKKEEEIELLEYVDFELELQNIAKMLHSIDSELKINGGNSKQLNTIKSIYKTLEKIKKN